VLRIYVDPKIVFTAGMRARFMRYVHFSFYVDVGLRGYTLYILHDDDRAVAEEAAEAMKDAALDASTRLGSHDDW
jgi:hypothetical protein